MPCHTMHPIQDLFFWKVFHMYYNLICNFFISTPICTKFYSCKKWVLQKTTLEGMIQSHDELILEMAEEYGLNHMGENNNDEDECHTPILKSTEPKPPYVCPGCLITRIATI
jgi:hypothetical protein